MTSAGPADSSGSADVEALLAAIERGDRDAASALMPLLYEELRGIAGRHLRRERTGHTLQTTALVHEAFLRMVGQRDARWSGREHFLAVASTVMRRILVNHARERRRLKRGGDRERIAIDVEQAIGEDRTGSGVDLLALDECLRELAAMDEQQASIVEMRFFGGLTEAEVARVLGISDRTVRRDWSMARSWLRSRLEAGGEPSAEEGGAGGDVAR